MTKKRQAPNPVPQKPPDLCLFGHWFLPLGDLPPAYRKLPIVRLFPQAWDAFDMVCRECGTAIRSEEGGNYFLLGYARCPAFGRKKT